MKLAIVGVTGLVGSTFLKVLEERNFPISELVPVASERSKGKFISYKGIEYPIVTLEEAVEMDCQIALFSAGGSISLEWAPRFAEKGCYVIDNSSAWRMDPSKKLVVPEINANILEKSDYIIANPNCSTTQMVMVLKPLQDKYGIKRVIVSTYQSVSGSGQKGIDQLMQERQQIKAEAYYPHPIDFNLLPHIDSFTENGYTKEEMKMVLETQKILNDQNIMVSPTTVRVPVTGGHSESVNIELKNDFVLEEVKDLLAQTNGIIVEDEPNNNQYPMPLYAAGKDEVFVGRIRRDFSQPNSLNCWIVADNLRKGATTNAIQIAEYLIKNIIK